MARINHENNGGPPGFAGGIKSTNPDFTKLVRGINKHGSTLHHQRNWNQIPNSLGHNIDMLIKSINLPITGPAKGTPIEALKQVWKSQLQAAAIQQLDESIEMNRKGLRELNLMDFNLATEIAQKQLRKKFGNRFRFNEFISDSEILRRELGVDNSMETPGPTVPLNHTEPPQTQGVTNPPQNPNPHQNPSLPPLESLPLHEPELVPVDPPVERNESMDTKERGNNKRERHTEGDSSSDSSRDSSPMRPITKKIIIDTSKSVTMETPNPTRIRSTESSSKTDRETELPEQIRKVGSVTWAQHLNYKTYNKEPLLILGDLSLEIPACDKPLSEDRILVVQSPETDIITIRDQLRSINDSQEKEEAFKHLSVVYISLKMKGPLDETPGIFGILTELTTTTGLIMKRGWTKLVYLFEGPFGQHTHLDIAFQAVNNMEYLYMDSMEKTNPALPLEERFIHRILRHFEILNGLRATPNWEVESDCGDELINLN